MSVRSRGALFFAAIAATSAAPACRGTTGDAGAEGSPCAGADAAPGRSGLASTQEGIVAVLGLGGEGFVCSGALLAPNKVLTARHCLDDHDDGDVLVVFGPDAARDLEEESIGVVAVALHPTRDLAVLTLEEETDHTPLELGAAAAVGSSVVAVGYGGPLGDAERCLRVEARATVTAARGDGAIDVTTAGGELCEGDSGGPLLVQTNDGPVVVGALSTVTRAEGEECGRDATYAPTDPGDAWLAGQIGGAATKP